LRWHGDGSEIIKQPALIEGLLPETGAGLLSGQWGTYKTFVAVDISGAVMTGGFFLDFPVARRGGVLFIAAEGASSIDIRLQAMLAEKYPATAKAPFTWLCNCPALLSPKFVTLLTEMARKADERMLSEFGMPLVLIVIDTITAAAGYSKSGDENDAAVASMIMNRLAALSRGTGALVLAIDHFGKSIEVGTRGSSAKEAAADVVLATLGDKAVSGEVTNTRLAVRKNRTGPSGQEFAFATRLVEIGDSGGSLVIDWQPHKPNPKAEEDRRWSKSLRLLRQCLMNMLADCGSEQRPYADGPLVRAVDQETLRGEFCKSYPADGTPGQKADARRQAFSRAIRDAQRKELIGVRDVGTVTFVWLATPKTHD
jgi:AAA domain